MTTSSDKDDLRAYRIARGLDNPKFKTVKSRIYLETEQEEMNTKLEVQRIFDEVKKGVLEGHPRSSVVEKLGIDIKFFNNHLTKEQSTELAEIWQKNILSKRSLKFELYLDYLREGFSESTALRKAGFTKTNIFSDDDKKQVSDILKSVDRKPTRKGYRLKPYNFEEKFIQIERLMNSGYKYTVACQIAGVSIVTVDKYKTKEQAEKLDLMIKRYNENRKANKNKEVIVEVERTINELSELDKFNLAEGTIQIHYHPERNVSKYLLSVLSEVFPNDPCCSIKKDNKSFAPMYLKAWKKGMWQVSEKAFDGVKVFEI